jgi:hypothetical protein
MRTLTTDHDQSNLEAEFVGALQNTLPVNPRFASVPSSGTFDLRGHAILHSNLFTQWRAGFSKPTWKKCKASSNTSK